MSKVTRKFDYIIVGAGSAGCLLAKRLSEDPSVSVLLIEAGGRDTYPWTHIPVGYLYCIDNPRTDWRFRTQPSRGLNGRSLLYPRGRTLGGCSSINGMIYMRGQARDYDHWAEITGDEAWRWESCLEDFRRHEDHYRLDDHHRFDDDEQLQRFHGHGGEWRVERQRYRWPILDEFAAAARAAGIPAADDFNRGCNEGVDYFEVNQRSGWRWNTSRAFLRKALKRPNLTLWHSTLVERLEFDTRNVETPRCTGVRVSRQGKSMVAEANREVILSAGAIGSPHLLQLSGIGPRELLERHGIEVIKEAPGVGENLQDHLQLRATYRLDGARTLNTMVQSWWGKAAIALHYLVKRSGPMSMAPSQLGIFTRSSDSQPHPNLEFHVQPLSLEAFGQPLHDFSAITASVCNLNPTSRGTVRLMSADPRDPPEISPNYLATAEDRQVAADSLRVVRRIIEQSPLAHYHPEELKPGTAAQSDEELQQVAGDIGTTIFHPVGTTAMGAMNDPMAVVDSRLRVQGVDSLRVVDAGVMPTIVSGNTNSPTLMIAEKAAAWVRQAVSSRGHD